MINPVAGIGEPAKRTNLSTWEWLKTSKLAALAWTAMRVWLGVMWIQAGSAKLWGTESAAFLHGTGVAGFAAHGTPAYSWWGSVLHSFVLPNADGIGILVAISEYAIGIALVAGLFTRIAALGSLALLFTYWTGTFRSSARRPGPSARISPRNGPFPRPAPVRPATSGPYRVFMPAGDSER